MITLKQLEANRANAKKSTGPKTAAGKAISARNLTRHGYLAAVVVLESESKARFYEVLDSLIAEFKPNTATENIFVENMAVARWRLLRYWRLGQHAVAGTDDAERWLRYEKQLQRSFSLNRENLMKGRTRKAQQFPSELRERLA